MNVEALDKAYDLLIRVVPIGDQYAVEMDIGGEDFTRVAVSPSRVWADNISLLALLVITKEALTPEAHEWVNEKRAERRRG